MLYNSFNFQAKGRFENWCWVPASITPGDGVRTRTAGMSVTTTGVWQGRDSRQN